jgi:hypothetical protein
MSTKKRENSRVAFVCAGFEGEDVFHMESDTYDSDRILLELIGLSAKWAKKKTASCNEGGNENESDSLEIKEKEDVATLNFAFKDLTTLETQPAAAGAVHCPTTTPSADMEVLKGFGKDEKEYYNLLSSKAKRAVLDSMHSLRSDQAFLIPLRFRILRSELPVDKKRKIIQKLERQQDSVSGGDAVKYYTWVEGILSIPLNNYVIPVAMTSGAMKKVLANASSFLDSVIFGHRSAKQASTSGSSTPLFPRGLWPSRGVLATGRPL